MTLNGLKYKKENAAVSYLKTILKTLGYPIVGSRQKYFDRSTEEAIKVFQRENDIPDTGRVDDPTAEALEVAYREKTEAGSSTTGTFQVIGTVRLADGSPASGIKISAFDQDLPSKPQPRQLLGTAKTDRSGAYQINYDVPAFSKQEYKTADLVIQATDAEGIQLGESEIHYNVPQEIVIDLTLEARESSKSEFNRYIGILMPVIEKDLVISTLTDEDLEFLTHETGIEKEYLSFLRLAYRWSKLTDQKVIPDVFYALLRMGFPTKIVRWLDKGEYSFQPALDEAMENKIIRVLTETECVKYLGKVYELVLRLAQTTSEEEGQASLKDILDTVLEDAFQQESFLLGYFKKKSDTDFWKELEVNPDLGEVAAKLKLSFELATLTLNNAQLIKPLVQGHNNLQELVKYDLSEWEHIITKYEVPVPSHLAGETEEEKTRTYARVMEASLEQQFPTAFVARQVSRSPKVDFELVHNAIKDQLETVDLIKLDVNDLTLDDWDEEKRAQLGESITLLKQEITAYPDYENYLKKILPIHPFNPDSFSNPIRKEVHEFLEKAPDFDIRTTPVNAYLREGKAEAVIADLENPEAVKSQLKRMQRVHNMAGSAELTDQLLQSGIDSAWQVASMTSTQFNKLFAGGIGNGQATDVHERASQISDQNALLSRLAHETYNGAFYPVITGEKTDATDDGLSGIANLQSLFGSQGFCDCDHCQSVYGPSAYFVDLLHHLLGGKHQGTSHEQWSKPYEELIKRRPDLKYLQLNCENAETEIPYIDLVNEILENYIALNPSQANSSEGYTKDELAANPQYVVQTAYDELKKAVYPTNLPFDHSTATADIFLDHLGSSRFELMETFLSADDQASKNAKAAAYLRLSEPVFELITGKKIDESDTDLPQDTYQLLGFRNDGHLGQRINPVPELLRRFDISLPELNALLKTVFINPSLYFPETPGEDIRPKEEPQIFEIPEEEDETRRTRVEKYLVLVSSGEEPCEIEKTNLKTIDNKWLSDEQLVRLVRFNQLWKHLNLTIPQTDLLLYTANQFVSDSKTITPSHIQFLAGVIQLHHQTKLPYEQLICLWGNMFTYGENSLFKRLFQNEAAREVDPIFTLNTNSTEFENPSSLIDAHLPALMAGFRISAVELEAIRKYASLTGEDATLNLSNLTAMFRPVILSRAVSRSILDTLSLLQLLDTNPLASPSAALDFLSDVGLINSSGVSIAELEYLLQHRIPVTQQWSPDKNAFNSLALKIHTGLEKINKDLANKQTELENKKQHLESQKDKATGDHLEDILKQLEILSFQLDQLQINQREHQVELISQIFGEEFDIDLPLARIFIEKILESPSDSSLTLFDYLFTIGTASIDEKGQLKDNLKDDFRKAYIKFYKIALFLNPMKLEKEELEWLIEHPANFDGLNFNSIPIESGNTFPFNLWLRLWKYVNLRNRLNKLKTVNLIDVFRGAEAEDLEQIRTALRALLPWKESSLDAVLGSDFGKGAFQAGADQYRNEIIVERIYQSLKLEHRLGIGVTNLSEWSKQVPDSPQLIKDAVRAKYSDKDWLQVSNRLNDKLRKKQRDALVAFTLQMDQIQAKDIQNADQLYGFFLIDVEMEPCMKTSRIVQANAAIQLFVQRILMNLESVNGLNPSMIDTDQWSWMKKYRVWEANRKVFLYPENWIEPELRDHKTPFFEELESELLQGEVTSKRAIKLFKNYVRKLDSIAKLEVKSIYRDGRTVHVVARTPNIPYQYFYRKQSGEGIWTPWEPISAHIEGDTLEIITFDGRLFLFWPVVVSRGSSSDSGKKELDIRIEWTEYEDDKWGPKKMAKGLTYTGASENFEYEIYADKGLDELEIRICGEVETNFVARRSIRTWRQLGQYLFTKGNTKPAPENDTKDLPQDIRPHYILEKEEPRRGKGRRKPKLVERHNISQNNSDLENVLLNISSRAELVTQKGFDVISPSSIFVYQDPFKSFFVTLNFYRAFYPETVQELLTGKVEAALFGNSNESISNGQDDSIIIEYHFQNFYHPFISEYISMIDGGQFEDILSIETQKNPESSLLKIPATPEKTIFFNKYRPTSKVKKAFGDGSMKYPLKEVDFAVGGSYSEYNWELFFHIPSLIANRLSTEGRYEEAQRWYHFIFNPIIHSAESIPDRYWNVLPFHFTNRTNVAKLLLSGDSKEKAELAQQIAQWRDNPFSPHLLARMRLVAYQKNIVFKYIDNLLNWGDHLFRQFTRDSVNEAIQIYLVAASILGEKPQKLSSGKRSKKETYASLQPRIDELGNVLVNLETETRFFTSVEKNNGNGVSPLTTVAPSLYFCVPENEKIWTYWDKVHNRLFKIRHCQDIEGAERQLALFEPPIDPALLVRARALGTDINSVLDNRYAPKPHYRFMFIQQEALELCNEVKSLGNNLLSVLEKKDAEKLAGIRAEHERSMLQLIRKVKESSIIEVEETIGSLSRSLESAKIKKQFYDDPKRKNLSAAEKANLSLVSLQIGMYSIAASLELIASVTRESTPDLGGGFSGFGPFNYVTYGGGAVSGGMDLAAKQLLSWAAVVGASASLSSTLGSYERRKDEWALQLELAKKEEEQIKKQILAAEIRKAIAEMDLENHEKQIENAEQTEEFLRQKFTNQELYGWMQGQISGLYYQCYNLAYDLAKQAEKAYRFERGEEDTNFIQFGSWDSSRKGLLAGEQLYFSLKQMEKSYYEKNKREYELSKPVSLKQLNPLALITLKEMGECEVELPEAFFDMDYPGHYMRRIKNVSISIPAIIGPYTNVNCTLTLISSRIRKDKMVANGYQEEVSGADPDSRFMYDFSTIDSIATSTAQNDDGLFELSFRDERYLPFEGSGVISKWRIEMPKENNQFDFDTISDVILHLNYTARNGGESLKTAASNHLETMIPKEGSRIFSIRHEFTNEWHRFLHPETGSTNPVLEVPLTKKHFPFFARNKNITIDSIHLYGEMKDRDISVSTLDLARNESVQELAVAPAQLGKLRHWHKEGLSIPAWVEGQSLKFVMPQNIEQVTSDNISDIFLLVGYRLTEKASS